MLSLSIGIAAFVCLNWGRIMNRLEPFFNWFLVNPVRGLFVYIAIYITFVPLMLPGAILTFTGAFIFG